MSETEREQAVYDLSEREFMEQVDQARILTNGVYATNAPLRMLGYNGGQIRALENVYSATETGEAVDAKRNQQWPFYKHNARFENESGSLAFAFSGNGDFRVHGWLNTEARQREHLPIDSHPHLFLLRRRQSNEELDLKDISQRIFRGVSVGETNAVKKALVRVPLVRHIPAVALSYESMWLDEDTKTEAVFHFPADDNYEVFRRIRTANGYEVWGRKKDVDVEQLKRDLAEKNKDGVLKFQLAAQPTGALL